MRIPALIAMLSLPLVATSAFAGERIVMLALPSQQVEPPPQRPVGDPDAMPIGLELFDFDFGSSREEAWPWPPLPDEN